jgi:hypothetical protein
MMPSAGARWLHAADRSATAIELCGKTNWKPRRPGPICSLVQCFFSYEAIMRPITLLLFAGLSLASLAACAPVPGNTYPKTALAQTCDRMEGYPDCHSGRESTLTREALRAPAHAS